MSLRSSLWFTLFAGALLTGLLAATRCSEPEPKGPAGMLLAQAVFQGSDPLPGQVVVAYPPDGSIGADSKPVGWTYETFSSTRGSDVFHKALSFQPKHGEPGILTISANPAYVELWHRKDGAWSSEVVWHGVVGNVEKRADRLRDVEVADVDGDGDQEIVIVTHDQGVVMILEQSDTLPYQATEIDRSDEVRWIHEVEIGDVDGDGQPEIFCTPSEPNNLDGQEQAGWLKMFRRVDGKWQGEVLKEYPTRHVKEILCADVDGDGRKDLVASLEGENIGAQGGASSALELFRWVDGKPQAEMIKELKGKLCRFLTCGDTDGDGKVEVVASTSVDGIWSVWKEGDSWQSRSVQTGFSTSGFEHATYLLDWDGDGRDDIFVASDNQGRFQRFFWDDQRARYNREKLFDLPNKSPFTFNLMPYPNPQR